MFYLMRYIFFRCFDRITVKLIFIFFVLFLSGILGCSRTYRITETYRFESVGEASEVYLAVMVPKSGPRQEIRDVEIKWDGEVEREDRGAVDLVKLSGSVNVHDTKEAVVSYEIEMGRQDELVVNSFEQRHLEPEADIQSDHPLIKAQAKELVTGKTKEDVYMIFTFVGDHIKSPKGNRMSFGGEGIDNSALTALEKGEGVCSEYANLFVALCRAAGIPAKRMGGLALRPMLPGTSKTKTWSHPGIAHAWAEYYVDGQWNRVDPTYAAIPGLRKLMFNSRGLLIDYGEVESETAVFNESKSWIRSKDQKPFWMTAPNKYVGSMKKPSVKFTPIAEVKKKW